MTKIIIPLAVSQKQLEQLKDIGGFEGTDLYETLHEMIERQYISHCEHVAAFIEECRKDGDISELDDELPF